MAAATTAPSDAELEKYLTVKSTIAAVADATGLASALTIYIQARKNDDLEHRSKVEDIALANVILLGIIFVTISFVGIWRTKPRDSGYTIDKPRSISITAHLILHYVIGVLTLITTILAIILAAISGKDGTMTTAPPMSGNDTTAPLTTTLPPST